MIKNRYKINYDTHCNLWCVWRYRGDTLLTVSGYKTRDEAEAFARRREEKPISDK